MIKAVLVVNNHGKPRLVKFYESLTADQEQKVIREVFQLIGKRSDRLCNFLEGGTELGKEAKIIYRHYATLYFIFIVDSLESELGILDLIQVFVEALDRCFENVCELDLIFHSDKVLYILDEVVMGGLVLETHLPEVIAAIDEQNKLEREDNPFAQLSKAIENIRR